MSNIVKKRDKRIFFRRVIVQEQIYYLPCTEKLAKILPKSEIFYGTFSQALTLEKLTLMSN